MEGEVRDGDRGAGRRCRRAAFERVDDDNVVEVGGKSEDGSCGDVSEVVVQPQGKGRTADAGIAREKLPAKVV